MNDNIREHNIRNHTTTRARTDTAQHGGEGRSEERVKLIAATGQEREERHDSSHRTGA